MTEFTNGVENGETPVNPYSLLEAVNRSSDTANTAWLIFLAIMAYLMVAVAGVTHQDFLVGKPVSLPVLQVDIQLTQFFQFAPILLLLLHIGIVSQLVLLARKALEFDKAIRLLETSKKRTHPLRLELHNFFFVQAIAGPQRSPVMGGFLHAMSWLTLAILPVVLMLYIQVVFLPYHDVVITWTHRIALLLDVIILVLIGVFLMQAETSFFKAMWRTTASSPLSVFVTAGLLGLVSCFSLFIATVPGEYMDRVAIGLLGSADDKQQSRRDRRYRSGFLLPFGLRHGRDDTLFGLFRRNLVVTDTDLVVDKDATPGEPTLSLRGRDLRYAKLDRSDLHQADLTGANLNDASLEGTDLRDAWLNCSDLNELLLSDNREQANCTWAQRTSFKDANLSGAKLTGIDATDANFETANMRDAQLTYALLANTVFSSAKLQNADFTGGVQAQGANFLIASLEGADLTGAQLQNADFSSASLLMAKMNYAHLQGAKFQGATLDGASLLRAQMQGADLSDATIKGLDLRWASVWGAKPPTADDSGLADLSSVNFKPLTSRQRDTLKNVAENVASEQLRSQMTDALAPLIKTASGSGWGQGAESQAWRAVQDAGYNQADVTPYYRKSLSNYLTSIMCQPRWRLGAVAAGVARRAQDANFRGDRLQIYKALTNVNCPASAAIADDLLSIFPSGGDLVVPLPTEAVRVTPATNVDVDSVNQPAP